LVLGKGERKSKTSSCLQKRRW